MSDACVSLLFALSFVQLDLVLVHDVATAVVISCTFRGMALRCELHAH